MTEPITRIRRPLLPPALTRVWRGSDCLQLGAGTRTPVVVAGVDPRDARFLLSLDGRRDRVAALAHAATLGLTPSRAERLLWLLESGDCLADAATDTQSLASLAPADRDRLSGDVAALSLVAPVRSLGLTAFARRRAACVEVRGASRVGAAVTALLAASGVGTVSVVDDEAVRPGDVAPLGPHPGSVGQPRSDAAVAAARRTAPNMRRDADRPPDLVVLTGSPVIDPAAADTLLGSGVPHLPVTMLETTATVGPLILPGGGPCLRCIDLHRSDRDPDWPLVAAQLGTTHGRGGRGEASRSSVEACDVVLATCAAALASLTVLGWLSDAAHGADDSAPGTEIGTAYVCGCPAASHGGGRIRRTLGADARGEGDNEGVTELPRRAVTRTAKLASLPLGFAGRKAIGVGKRVGGRPADLVAAEIQRATAEQVFRVLGELKGGAMKFGQAMSVFEAAFPEEMAGPYREMLTKLQEAAPPMDAAAVHRVLAESFGRQWRRRFQSFNDTPAAAASIGQVHRAVWKDGTDVAVKVQYPGAEQALQADLAQIVRMGRLFGALVPGMDVKPLAEELRDRMIEELDYRLEREAQQGFYEAYRDDPSIAVPAVLDGAQHVVVSEWMEGRPLSRVIAEGTQAERDHAGQRYVHFLFASPARAGLLHADPHPGNYRILADGRLGVLDYGAVARLPGGLSPAIGRLLSVALAGDATTVEEGLRTEGFIKPKVSIDAQSLLDYLAPFVEPASHPTFRFDRPWMQEQFRRINDPRSENWSTGLKLNLPPEYLLVHRVWLGGIGVLCQLGAEVSLITELETWLPGFTAPD